MIRRCRNQYYDWVGDRSIMTTRSCFQYTNHWNDHNVNLIVKKSFIHDKLRHLYDQVSNSRHGTISRTFSLLFIKLKIHHEQQ